MNKTIRSLLFPLILVVVNIISILFFFRKDLTEEKRYSISDASKSIVSGLEEPIEIEVLLDGDELPGGFERLKQAVEETLGEFKTYGGANVSYTFFDPNSLTNPEEKKALIDSLYFKGVQPTNVFDTDGGRKTETMVFPFALVSYQGKEQTVLLLQGNQALSAEEKLNQSYENLEYSFASAFRKLTIKERKRIGLLTEFTSLEPINFAGLINALQEYYDLYFVDAATSESFLGLDALILPKPDIRIDDSTKYKIDQYVMNGGKTLFFIDGLKVDSIGLQGTYAQPFESNLQDLFFKYGIRLNYDMIKDGASAAMVPLVVGNMGDKPNIQPIPYRFFPLINNFGQSLITKNLDLVESKFTSSIDTVLSSGISKTALLKTTPYTKILNAPALVTYNDARSNTDQQEYNGGEKTIAYLLEGKFSSLYENRILPSDPRSGAFKAKSEPTKMIVCSDGDLIVNELDRRTGEPMPLGYDKVSQHTFGNKDFLMNAIDYLVDENGVINARGKEVKLRPLDAIKTRDNRTQIQLVNLVIPSILIIIFGLVRGFFWRRKYAH
ncbi:gliding motility-associated ABC transporter substrate-binding protein GldG [Arcticibacterium luteifluviistationis]|uniref:Gliding motility-associated ABC transporter substrate-binding protein GldG n=1 Tax=Arcticibacterium luteifluviistationis TaxID=1784714 RepID=A0A2Z4GEU0_9BACT|nr:gliding motility-associated ABC transporter substrate-binding protein GldG [Arcticibacterium luteifluviistationis]AWV99710.1 gliding motility-associated ABC transporter substrate-binding protein GldG [Arcticibacterium luteifluviistationis]